MESSRGRGIMSVSRSSSKASRARDEWEVVVGSVEDEPGAAQVTKEGISEMDTGREDDNGPGRVEESSVWVVDRTEQMDDDGEDGWEEARREA